MRTGEPSHAQAAGVMRIPYTYTSPPAQVGSPFLLGLVVTGKLGRDEIKAARAALGV